MKQMKLKSSHLGFIIIVGTLSVLLFILIATVGFFFFTNQLNAAAPMDKSLLTYHSPLNVEQIDPALALISLGGVAEADLVSEAINKARPETALASLLFQPKLADEESAGAFLQLAPIYTTNGHPQKALLCYKMAGMIATLSPDILNTARADLFIQVSEGLITLNEPNLAKFYLGQAFSLASRSPFLQIVHRRDIFERLQKNYIFLGERELARKSLDLSANPPVVTFLTNERVFFPKSQPILYTPEIQEAEAQRWLKAQELAALLVDRGGKAPPSAETALKEALLWEDEQKLPFFEIELAAEAQLSRKIDLAVAKIEWLSIKYRVARQAYGLNLVPEWVEQVEQIRADLTKTYETLFALYADLIIALPQASQIDKATEERLRREILVGELGRYPNYPEEQRKKQLLDATNQLIDTQPELNVFVGVRQIDNQALYTFISQEVSGE